VQLSEGSCEEEIVLGEVHPQPLRVEDRHERHGRSHRGDERAGTTGRLRGRKEGMWGSGQKEMRSEACRRALAIRREKAKRGGITLVAKGRGGERHETRERKEEGKKGLEISGDEWSANWHRNV